MKKGQIKLNNLNFTWCI